MLKRSFLIFLILIIPFSLLARENYYYVSYSVDCVLSEDGTMHYTEDILVNFTSPMHGIYRDIKYYFDEADPFYPIVAAVDNFQIINGGDVEITKSDGYYSIRFGSADRYVEGPVRYTFSYDFNLGPDRYSAYDEFYQNMLSSQNDFPIKRFSFSLTLPKKTELNGKLFVTYGEYGSARLLTPTISDDGLKISGSLENLKPYDAVTLRVEFPEGYYVNQSSKDNTILFKTISIALSIALLVYSYLIYRKYGIDDDLVSPVRFNAPDGVTPIDSDYLLNRSLNGSRDTLGMLFYWADRGYVEIEDKGKNDFEITALKALDSASSAEKTLYREMFGKAFPATVTVKDLGMKNLPAKFQTKVVPSVQKSFVKDKALFDDASRSKRLTTLILSAFSAVLASVAISARYLGLALILSLIVYGFNFLLFSFFADRYTKKTIEGRKAKSLIVLSSIFGIVFIFFSNGLGSIFGPETLGILHSTITSIALILTIFLGYATEKRSEYYTKALEALLGYEDFIKTVEENKLKTMVEEDPSLFYHTLSYAIVFGLADVWAKKFKGIYIAAPDWYRTSSYFDYLIFMDVSDRWNRAYRTEMPKYAPSAPSGTSGGSHFTHSGSSGFSGGGFSGGGSRGW